MIWAGSVATSKLLDCPHSHIKQNSVPKACWTDMPSVCEENALSELVTLVLFVTFCQFFADDFQPRTRETHQHHCSQLDGPMYAHVATTYGVYRDCILNSSRYFHICDGLAPDIMHDILEGSLQYEVKELLKHLIQTEHFFTLKELNDSIEGFPYVAPDKATKPTIIAPQVLSSSDKSLKQKGN